MTDAKSSDEPYENGPQDVDGTYAEFSEGSKDGDGRGEFVVEDGSAL